ncbi:SIR2 family protein [Neiella marina]|uniref:SIR2 family protein n=1 Tax=Neiella holothuriorum TaxID=2870530 RepID=A0ABS7EE74_9GAMM|nr:SIR2 family protein [Neiella holothuriorum]MBW8190644.1 SIR2 family protein [Neiella holothuriorum]
MILSGVNFPPKLIDAAEQGNLVVFAGAGVSMGEPSNLPSFWKLAEDIARGFGYEPKEPLDQFLGSLSPDESVIQNATVNTLQSINSQPKELHSHLLNMFTSSGSVRVVTTNFDPLFTEASSNIWTNKPEIYTAPALPLGYDFEGIVHIHGANTNPKSIVVTDRGFGKAYLTDGWASRFLMQMFETYTVLFVGYSHDDMVMSYLARALPDKAKGKRFALVGSETKNQDSKWQSLGIEPVYFPQEHEHDYDELSSSTKALSDFLRRRPSDWQEHIGRIAEQDGPLDLEDEHAIQHALNDVAKVRYFTSRATSEKWAFWLHDQDASSEARKHFKDCLSEDPRDKFCSRVFSIVETCKMRGLSSFALLKQIVADVKALLPYPDVFGLASG